VSKMHIFIYNSHQSLWKFSLRVQAKDRRKRQCANDERSNPTG
jgi:hypothetical protein